MFQLLKDLIRHVGHPSLFSLGNFTYEAQASCFRFWDKFISKFVKRDMIILFLKILSMKTKLLDYLCMSKSFSIIGNKNFD